MKRGGNMKSRKKLARLLAVLVASSMVLGSPNAVAFAEGNEISEESLSGEKTAAAPAEAKESAEQKEPVSEEISDEGTNTPVKKAEAEQTGAAVSNTEKTEAEPKKSGKSGPEKEEKPETVQAFLAALDKIMELQENDAEAEKVLAAVEEAKKLYGALSEEEKALEEVKAGYEALESFESVNSLEEVELNGKGTEEDPWRVGSEEELTDAIGKVKGAAYIRLTEDIDISNELGIAIDGNNVEITLDLNGYTVHGTEVDSIFWIYSGKLTVEGSGGKIENTAYKGSIFSISGGELRLSGGTYSSEKGTAIISNSSTITVDAGTVVEGTTGMDVGMSGEDGDEKSIVTVNGTVCGTEKEYDLAAVTVRNGALTITGQIIATGNCKGIEICGGSTVKVCPGATISSENSEAICLRSEYKNEGVNITGGTITGKNGIVVRNGTLNIRGDSTITGNGTDLKASDEVGHPTPSGAGVLIYKWSTNNISVTVEDAEITGKCAIYAVTEPTESESVDETADINVNLRGGRFTSTAETDVAEGKPLKAAFNLSEIKGETSKVSLTLFGGSYFGGEDSEAYIKYYRQYCAADYDIEKEEGTGYYKVVNKTAKAEVTGGEKYSTLQEAIDAAKTGDTVTLLADTEENVMISKGQEITLDLNGKTLNGGTVEKKAALTNNGIVTIMDSQTGGTIKREDDGTTNYYTVQNNYKMYIKGGTITNNSNTSNLLINYNNQGNKNYGAVEGVYMEISGGTISQTSMSALKNDPGCTMKITGDATVIERQRGNLNYNYASNFYGTVIMDGGTLKTDGLIGFFAHKNANGREFPGSFTITGSARLECNEIRLVNGISGGVTSNPPTLTISGKTEVKAEKLYQLKNNSITDAAVANIDIGGGIFSGGCVNDNATKGYIIPTMEMNDAGRVVPLTAETGVAEVGGKYYNSLQAAVAAAKNGDTVILLKDTREDITVSKEIGLDLNGKTITGNTKTYAIQVNSGNLTIKDGSEEKSGKLIATRGALAVGEDGIFVLDSGTLHADSFYGCYVSDGGKMVVNGGEIISAYAAIAGNNTTGDMNFEIHGGILTAKEGPAIYMPGQGSLRMDGGTLNGGISLRMGQVEISGGTINAASEVYRIGDIIAEGAFTGKPNYTASGNVFLSDAIYALAGAYASSNVEYGNLLSLKITGGTINVANGAGTAVAIYDLGKVKQDIRIEVAEGAVLSTNTADRHLVEVLTLEEAGIANPESGYGVTENKTTEKIAEKFEHTYPSTAASVTKNATCTENGEGIFVCSVCGESKTGSIPALGHNWVNDRCERCGTERNTGDDGGSSGSGSSGGRRSSSRDEILNAGGASPMLIPVPQQPAVQMPAAPTPAATQPAAAAPEPLPAEEPAQLEDESVPLAEAGQEETKGREEPEKVINIGDEEVPMAAPSTSWAFLNLILMLVTAAGAIATVIGSVRRKGEEAEETGSTVWMIGLIPAICSTAMFVLTEKIGGSIAIADRWTVAMLLIALVEGAVVFFVYRMMNKAHNRA